MNGPFEPSKLESLRDALRAQASAWRLKARRLDERADSDGCLSMESVEAAGMAQGVDACALDLEALIARWFA